MVVKNVKTNWNFIKNVDDNGNFRVSFIANKELDNEINSILTKLVQEKGKDVNKVSWPLGSRKVSEDGIVTYTAKASQLRKNKKGEEFSWELPVFNKQAQRLNKENIPSISNGSVLNIEVVPYYTEYKNKYGAMLGLRSVQLIDYSEFSSNPYSDESTDNNFSSSSDSNIEDPFN